MADWDVILAPATVTVRIILHEAMILMHSLRLLNIAHQYSGFADWISQTAAELDEERKAINQVAAEVADHVAYALKAISAVNNMPFLDFIKAVEQAPAPQFRDAMLSWVREKEGYPGDEVMIASRASYLEHMQRILEQKHDKKEFEFDEAIWNLRYDYLLNPEQMKRDSVEHLRYMWDTCLKAEWKRTKGTLQEAVEAFSQVDFSNMTGFEVIEAITGRNMRGKEDFEEAVNRAKTITFIPSPHLGPYIGWGPAEDWPRHLVFIFGARLPKNAVIKSTALSRSELLVRLNALADETRLKMLELLTQHDEMCAQDFINELDLSQSSASRHLRQLTASGYLSERRRDVAKCYSINPDRVEDTIRALKEFLRKE